MIIQPFTYYRNIVERRAFLVADVVSPEHGQTDESPVRLIEWGKDKAHAVQLPVAQLTALIQRGLMQEFIPQYE